MKDKFIKVFNKAHKQWTAESKNNKQFQHTMHKGIQFYAAEAEKIYGETSYIQIAMFGISVRFSEANMMIDVVATEVLYPIDVNKWLMAIEDKLEDKDTSHLKVSDFALDVKNPTPITNNIEIENQEQKVKAEILDSVLNRINIATQ